MLHLSINTIVAVTYNTHKSSINSECTTTVTLIELLLLLSKTLPHLLHWKTHQHKESIKSSV